MSISRLLITTALVVPIASPAFAQDEQPSGNAGEIIVTAQKREQSLNDVGAPIVAFGGELLKDKQIVSFADLAATVPGLNFSITGAGTPVYTLRGVGFTDATLSAYPDVSVYVDQIPLPFLTQTKNANFDLERVEVLLGPQGTLFGSNATGGAINYIAAKPTNTPSGGISVTYGRFNNLLVDGFASAPVSDTVKVRLAGRVHHRDDWQYSYTRKDTTGKISTSAARLLVDFEPTDRLSLELNVNGWVDKSDPQQSQLYQLALQSTPANTPDVLLEYPLAPRDPRAADWVPDFPKYGDSWLFQTTLRGALELTDDITLTSLTGLIRSRYDVYSQGNGVSVPSNIYAPEGDFDNIFQELRLDNGGASRFRWTLGLNYQEDNADELVKNNYSVSSVNERLGLTGARNFHSQDSKNYAAFGNIEFDPVDLITLKGGLRYTKTIRKDESCTTDDGSGSIAGYFTVLNRLLTGDPTLPALGVDDCVSINPATSQSERFFGKLTEDNVSYRFGVDVKPSDDVLLYANVAKGYKAGGFPSTTASAFPELAPVSQESLINYETGVKLSLADRSVFVTGSAFYYDYRDKQLRAKVITPLFGALNSTINIPKSSVKGVEGTLTTRPLSGFTPMISFTYLDAKIKEFEGVNAGGQLADYSGTRMPLAPKYSLNADLQYETRLTDNADLILGGAMTYRSSTNALVGVPAEYEIPAYTLFDLRAGVSVDNDRWKVMAFGKNITNEYYVVNVVRQYDLLVRYTGEPLTYGVTVSHQF